MSAGYVLWLTGLSGAGKSTIAGLVADELARRSEPHESLDGDVLRTHLTAGLGFSREDRDTNVLRVGWVAGLLARHGVGAITAVISPYADTRARVRDMVPNFVEVFVDASVDECARRDVKGLYARARAGEITNLTGVGDPYEPPPAPELHLRTDHETPSDSAHRVVDHLEREGLIGGAERARG